MSFENAYQGILDEYYKEYMRPLKYICPINTSKSSNQYLVNEQNQTINFYTAVRNYYNEDSVVAWFELSIGVNLPQNNAGRKSTNAIDGIIYIPNIDTLLIVEAKGLRKETKFAAILDDFYRSIGQNRKNANNYKIELKKPEHIYAITLADIWGVKAGNNIDAWDIDFRNSNLSSINKCEGNYDSYKIAIGNKGKLFSSQPFDIGGKSYRLLSMLYEMSEEEIDTYTFK